MPRFTVHSLGTGGHVLNVQSDFLDRIDTRVVVPLLPSDSAPPTARYLNPVFDVDGQSLVMVTQSIAAVPASVLGREAANLSHQQDEITRALDMLFQGF